MIENLESIRNGRARAEILKLVRSRHAAQKSRMDHVEMWYMLRGIGIDVGENDLLTFLQDLEVMNCIQFNSNRNRLTNRIEISQIHLTAHGLAMIEGRIKDDAVLF